MLLVSRPKGGISVKRLTEKNRDRCEMCTSYVDGVCIEQCYPCDIYETYARLAAIEDSLGDDYDLSRLRELVQADRDGRCVVIPSGGFDDKDGENALKSAMHTVFYHNNPVTRYIADAVSEKLVREAAEEALKGEKHG